MLFPGQFSGRCRLRRRAERAIRAGMRISRSRMVAVVALVSFPPAMTARVRVRLNAIVAQTSQAALAGNRPEGRWARAEFFRSRITCSTLCGRPHNVDYADVLVIPILCDTGVWGPVFGPESAA